MLKFDEIIEINGQKLTKQYIQSLSKEERLELIDPIFNILRNVGFIYMDDKSKIKKSYAQLLEYDPDITNLEVFNNSSLATDICKYFCHTFYLATEKGKPNIIDNFNDDNKLKRIIENRLGLDWLETDDKGPGVNEAFNLSFKMIVFQGQRSMRFVNATSMFKPSIAKYMCMKYSNEKDICLDYSCGFGGRMLGAVSCGRKYIGIDPLTVPELQNMADYFKLENCILINSGSENYIGEESSVDFSYSSPSYYNQEVYSNDLTQAYNNGEDYFYNIYWRKTLENVKFMLKPDKWFGVNVKNYPKMVEMAQEQFGEIIEEVQLKTVRSHLNKKAGDIKHESIYMFKNIK
jgi:hypothetical protein